MPPSGVLRGYLGAELYRMRLSIHGKLTQKWLEEFEEFEPSVHKGKRRVEGYVWGARVGEPILTLIIIRWEERNDGVHGNS